MWQILLPSSLLFWGLLCCQTGVSFTDSRVGTLGTIFPSSSLSLRSLHLLQANALPSHPLSSLLPAPRWHVQNFIHSGNITQTASSLKKKKKERKSLPTSLVRCMSRRRTCWVSQREKERTDNTKLSSDLHTQCYGKCALSCHIRTHTDTHTHHDQCHHSKN